MRQAVLKRLARRLSERYLRASRSNGTRKPELPPLHFPHLHRLEGPCLVNKAHNPPQSGSMSLPALAPNRESCPDLILGVRDKQRRDNILQGLCITDLLNTRLHPGQRGREAFFHK